MITSLNFIIFILINKINNTKKFKLVQILNLKCFHLRYVLKNKINFIMFKLYLLNIYSIKKIKTIRKKNNIYFSRTHFFDFFCKYTIKFHNV